MVGLAWDDYLDHLSGTKWQKGMEDGGKQYLLYTCNAVNFVV